MSIYTNTGNINQEILVRFIAGYAYSEVGKDRMGNPTTLCEEIAKVAKWISRADVCRLSADPYRQSSLAFAIAEMTDEERGKCVMRNYTNAFRKILWFNTLSRTYGTGVFITRPVNPGNLDDVQETVDSFETAIRQAAISKADAAA